MSIDFTILNYGSVILLHVHTAAARAWVEAHLPEDRQTFGEAVAVEPRYIADIIDGILADGLGFA